MTYARTDLVHSSWVSANIGVGQWNALRDALFLYFNHQWIEIQSCYTLKACAVVEGLVHSVIYPEDFPSSSEHK